MSEEQVFRPTPGRDAMTRDGRRVTDLRLTEWNSRVLRGWIESGEVTRTWWRNDGVNFHAHRNLDLVADWPDADPLPDADGWRKHTPGPCPVDPETVVEVRFRTMVSMEVAAKNMLWDEAGGATITHYRIVRPAPSGPVVEETVKRIVPIGSDEWADQAERLEWAYIAGIMRELAGLARAPLPSYIQPAIDIAEARATEGWRTFRARQIGEAMEGK